MRLTGKQVLLRECYRLGVTPNEMCGKGRTKTVFIPRHAIYYTLFTECPHLSLPSIGAIMGGRDHTTIINGIKRHCARIKSSYEDAVKLRVENAAALGAPCSSVRVGYVTQERFIVLMQRYGSVMESARAA